MTSRVNEVRIAVKKAMNDNSKTFEDLGDIFNEETINEPLIVRRAIAEAAKLKIIPKHLWDNQIFAGSYTYNQPMITFSKDIPVYAAQQELETALKQGLSQNSIFGHIVPSYPKLLRLGISGILDTIDEKVKITNKQEELDFLKATKISLLGLADYASDFAGLCRDRSERCTDIPRKKELIIMAELLEHSPFLPPETLHQAMQSIWLVHVAFQLTGNSLAMGRVDQYLFPYYKSDIESGRITDDQCQEMFDLFLLKYNERAQNNEIHADNVDLIKAQEDRDKNWSNRTAFMEQQHHNTRDTVDATNHWLQNIVLGGISPYSGKDSSNMLSLIMLESFNRMKMTNPTMTVRLNSMSPEWLLQKASSTLINGGGQPAFFNDDTIIPSLMSHGIPLDDARDYTNDGCWEIIVPGRTDFVFSKINMLKCLEWALNNGKSRIDNKAEVPDMGDSDNFSYDDILDSFWKTLSYVVEGIMDKVTSHRCEIATIAPVPLLSALLEGPVEKGKDMTQGGAKFITYALIGEGMSHLIDSICAIKEIIFNRQLYTMTDLINALDSNFEGYEMLRRQLNDCPKYGNNDIRADSIGSEIIEKYSSLIKETNKCYDEVLFIAGVGTFSWYIAVGEGTGPSPDGRRSKQPVSSNFSPSAGSMFRGVTAAISSHAHMNTQLLTAGSPLDLGLNSKYVKDEKGQKRLVALLRSFVSLRGNMLTLTIADTDTFKKAQKNPENYSDLRVRMGGWSAYFTMLSKKQQEHHIKKSESGIF